MAEAVIKSRHVHVTERVKLMNVRARFAPSPTGIPHVGSIRTVLFNYFFAKKSGGKFILRIEDTDQAREVEGAVEVIEESLKWLGISWDEYYVQSERLEEYKKYSDELVSKGFAKEDGGAIRFNVPDEGKTAWIDAIGNKKIEFNNPDIEDFIILKSDGYPTYHLANVVDDHLMDITHVIRGDDWIPSAPKHLLLYKALGWEAPVFAHLPNVLGTDGKKLSKRRGAKSVLDYKKEGYLPDALLNYLMLLGFSPKDDREILSKEEFEKEFDLAKVNVAPATFDEKKLLWMNGEYIRKKKIEDLKKILEEFYKEDREVSEVLKRNSSTILIELSKTRMKTLVDFRFLIKSLFEPPDKTMFTPEQKKVLPVLRVALEIVEEKDWNSQTIFDTMKDIMQQYRSDGLSLFYVLFTGEKYGLPLFDVLQILGKEETLKRLS